MVDHSLDPNAPGEPGQDAAEAGDGGDRVAKALARAGIASRREVERLIAAGRVRLNGSVLDTPAVKISPSDVLTVDGKPVAAPEPARVWRYHKPAGLVTTHSDPKGRPTVFSALPKGLPRVISVGRLDLNTEGLLLLTNDGALARALELPATGLIRRYRARARGHVTQERLDRLADGMTVEGVRYGPIEARLEKAKEGRVKEGQANEGATSANLWITLTLSEGKNREVRKVLEALGLTVNRLIRLAYGPFQLGTLEAGALEEVGPRVIREQLGEFIAPENLPTGSRTADPPSSPAAARRGFKGDPEPRGKPVYKPGWAKPKKRPSRPHAKSQPKAKARTQDAAHATGSAVVKSSAPRSDRRPATSTSSGSPKPGAPSPKSSGARRPGPSKGAGRRPRGV
ncbi:MAG TPA: pseudouridine synthase [Caulobacteraceae bacterium]|jgi:23S rRNA pseudouridine2605 synthase|nr:pseudouridine synthase [Caulobacteraceae bacterium]